MANEWVEEQRQRIGESQKRLDELKAELAPKRQAEMSHAEPPAVEPPLAERMRTRRFWIVVILACINSNLLFHSVHDQLRKSNSATLIGLSGDQVKVARSTKGEMLYVVTVPLDDPRFSVELNQKQPSDLLGAALVNLVLLAVVLHSYWQESRIATEAAQLGKTAENPPHLIGSFEPPSTRSRPP